ncbi:hypothetical protein [Lutibacter maritimus]|jgi:hypothetical protein|uniref:Uncharacterized protein n=1 Tax=Lutibacter maritimus TaxID=593133 RepID=A0A1I6QQE8_9FLAO|nr:hypothetical protein [Lutibacter maritimus]SFS54721.1 hypothetical protein SAMN04488006_2023 [Lutibacter maritimus]
MNSTPQILEKKNLHLKVVKNSLKRNIETNRIYINTLFPNFSYRNHLGETVSNPEKCVML